MSLSFSLPALVFCSSLFLLRPSAPRLYSSSSHMHVSISLHSPALPLALTFHLSPVICSSLSPTPSFAPSRFPSYTASPHPSLSLSLSSYLYQWAKVILSSSSRWTDSACGRGQEKRGAEEQGFCYFIILTRCRGGNTTFCKPSVVRGGHLTCFGWLLKV